MELIKQVEINIDYILELVKKYHQDHSKNKEILVDIHKAIDASVGLRNKKDLILEFIDSLDAHSVVEEAWQTYIETKRREELEEIIKQENLNPEETYKFMQNAFRNGDITTIGDDLAEVLPPISLYSPSGERAIKVKLCWIKLRRFLADFLIFPARRWISRLTILRLFRSTPNYLNQQPNRPGVADHLDQLKTISHLYCGQILADMLPSCISIVIGRCLSMVDTRS